jgi:hypothetical protein
MGSMSASDASDAAPLPRLGEVFFDVRGSARSMRLSWYADTDVAVFSIWQAGTCTGTFRLPMGELERMIETLRRGPGGRPPADPAATAFADPRAVGGWDDAAAGDEGRAWEDEDAGPPDYRRGHDPAGYPPGIGPYPANIGPLDYTGAYPHAQYLPEAAGPGYDRESAAVAASSGPYNGEAGLGRGRRGKPPESFPYAPAAGP